MTVWVARVVPAGKGEADARSATVAPAVVSADRLPAARPSLPSGARRLLVASFLTGLVSIAVWGFGRELLTTAGHLSTLGSTLAWTILGGMGILGAFGGDLIERVGPTRSWVALTLTMGAGTALFALAPSSYGVVFTAAALFGASYIGLTGIVLLWAAQLYPSRTSFGVGIAFFTIAAGQAVGAPLVGRLIESFDAPAVFVVWGALTVIGAVLRPGAVQTTPRRVLAS